MQRIFPYIVPPTQYGATATLSLDRLLITDVIQGLGDWKKEEDINANQCLLSANLLCKTEFGAPQGLGERNNDSNEN